jgi:hypothetical protein
MIWVLVAAVAGSLPVAIPGMWTMLWFRVSWLIFIVLFVSAVFWRGIV